MSRSRVAVALALLAAVMSVAAVLVVDDWADTPDLPVDAAIGLSYSAAAVLVLSGTGGRRIGWLLLGIGFCGSVAALSAALSYDGIGDWIWVGGFLPLLTLVPLLYPDGHLPGPRWRPWVATSVAGMVLLAAGSATYPGDVAQAVFLVGAALLVPSCVAGAAALVVRWRGADGLVRRQVQVLLVPVAVLLVVTALQSSIPWPGNVLVQAVAAALVPVAIGVAVTRHRLYDLDLAVCRAVGGLSLAVCLAAIYVSLFLVVAASLPGGPTVAAATAAAVCGLLLHPLGVRLNRGVDRMFYGDRADPARVLEATGAALRDDLGEVPERVSAVIVESLRLGSATVVVGGTADGIPLLHRGEVVGALVVTPRAGETELSARDVDLLTLVGDQVAPAIAALRLQERLQQSRTAVVTAREEERRRLRRDLHDGVGAALAGVRLQVETAGDLVTEPVAQGLLRSAAAGVATAVDDVRAITDDLRPAVLDDLGLGAGLRGLADRMATPGSSIEVDVDLDGPLPAAVEVACYRIAAEALANAIRHAEARRVVVRLDGTATTVSLRVEDDGSGLPDRPRAGGLGLASMRQRAEEIGGRLTLTSTAAGTIVRADLPLEAT